MQIKIRLSAKMCQEQFEDFELDQIPMDVMMYPEIFDDENMKKEFYDYYKFLR